MYANVLSLLHALYPGKRNTSFDELTEGLKSQSIRNKLQKAQECGFYVGYHVCILNRMVFELIRKPLMQVRVLLKEGRACYTFSQYKDDILKRLAYLVGEYEKGKRRPLVLSGCFWDTNTSESSLAHRVHGTHSDCAGTRKRKAIEDLDRQDRKFRIVGINPCVSNGGQVPGLVEGEKRLGPGEQLWQMDHHHSSWIAMLVKKLVEDSMDRVESCVIMGRETPLEHPAPGPMVSVGETDSGALNELPQTLLVSSVEEAFRLEKEVNNDHLLKALEACKRNVYELTMAMRRECSGK